MPSPRSLHRPVGSFIEPLEDRIAPAAFVVTSNLDDGSAGTLRNEIASANSAGGSNTITFAKSSFGVIQLSSASLSITSDLTIKGPGFGKLFIEGDGSDRVFQIDSHTVKIEKLSISSGNYLGNGGAIYSNGPLTVTKTVISDSIASGGVGGAICDTTTGAFTLTHSVLDGNSSTGTNENGGALWVQADQGVLISGDTLFGNSAGGAGGAVWINQPASGSGNVAIVNSIISGNTSAKLGGGIGVTDASTGNGRIIIETSHVTANYAGTYGGGIYLNNAANVEAVLNRAAISGNVAGQSGGGIQDLSTQPVLVETCVLAGNAASVMGGAIDSQGFHNLTVLNSTIVHNTATDDGGGIAVESGAGNFTMIGTLVAANRASTQAGGLFIASTTGATLITGSTLESNISATGGGGAYITQTTAFVNIHSSIISGNIAEAGSGGGLDLQGNHSVLLGGDKISGNAALGTSDYTGGGVYIGGGGTFTISAGVIEGNHVFGDGGGVAVGATAAGSIAGTHITGNDSTAGGGGFYHTTGSSGIVHISKLALVTGNIANPATASNTAGEYVTP
jgi:hypothetical protein